MVNINIYAQGEALTIEQKCDPSKLDLTIDGGYSPYEVEWQAKVNGTWQTISGWPKADLSGSDGQEDFTSTLNYEEYKVIVHDNLCGFVEKEIVVDPCKCIRVELFNLGNVSECWHPNGQKNDGFISLEITGTSDYSIQWSNGETGSSINKLKTGYYVATITSGACEIIKYYTICCCEVITEQLPGPPVILCNQDGNLEITDSQVYSPTSTTSNDGSITLQVNGGRVFTWYFNGNVIAKTKNISGLGPGTYTIQISDGCNNYIQAEFTLVDCTSKNIILNASVKNTCKGYSIGSISINPAGGSSPYKFKWSNGKTTSSITDLSAGEYCVTVSDKDGCFIEKCFDVNGPDAVYKREGCLETWTCNVNEVVNTNNIGVFSTSTSKECVKTIQCNDGVVFQTQLDGVLTWGQSCEVVSICSDGTRHHIAWGFPSSFVDDNCIEYYICTVVINGVLIENVVDAVDRAYFCQKGELSDNWGCISLIGGWYCPYRGGGYVSDDIFYDCSQTGVYPRCPGARHFLNNKEIDIDKNHENVKVNSSFVELSNKDLKFTDVKNFENDHLNNKYEVNEPITNRTNILNNYKVLTRTIYTDEYFVTFDIADKYFGKLYDSTGRLITNMESDGNNTLHTNFSNLPSGLYFLMIMSENLENHTIKLIKP